MAFGQIDPARLEGDALRRWYLRSPADIEAERRQKAASTYDSFFSQQTSNPISQEASHQQDETSDGHPWSSWQQLEDGRWRGEREDKQPPEGQYKLAAASPRGFWDYWSPKGCQSCHGYTPDTLPPIGGHSPLPPNYSPRTGGGSGDRGAQPRGGDKKECDQQAASDSQICGRLRSPQDIAICRKTASDRYAYCLSRDGTIVPFAGNQRRSTPLSNQWASHTDGEALGREPRGLRSRSPKNPKSVTASGSSPLPIHM